MEDNLLLVPGPTNLSESVRRVMAEPQRSHTGAEFYASFKELVSLARYVFRNEKGTQLVFSGSGTIGMESTVVSTVGHGDRVLVITNGYFGKRMAMLNRVHGAKVTEITYEEGRHADPDELRKRLKENKYKAVFITHVDTSTSVRNPIKELVGECNSAGVFSVVDSVCGIGGEELDFDRLGADVAFTASQKALAGAPGAVLVAVSERMMQHFEGRKDFIESYYMNLLKWAPIMDDPKIYLATPSVQVLLALRQALVELKAEGVENRWTRHARLGGIAQDRLEGLGLDFVADNEYRANTVTSIWVKDGTAGAIQSDLEQSHHIVVARGISEDRDRMVRIGHFGILQPSQFNDALDKLQEVLGRLGITGRTPVQLARSPKTSE